MMWHSLLKLRALPFAVHVQTDVAGEPGQPGLQVLDLRGAAIPGLYACGDSAGGFGQHGICRAATFGRLAGWHAAAQAA